MEFLFPVKYSVIRYERVVADSVQDALSLVTQKAHTRARFELDLADDQFEVLAPRLALSTEEREAWPYWEYGYTGTDGLDWRVGYTDKGQGDIPSFAESRNPVPADWLESWKK